MSKRHQNSRRKAYGRRQHEVRERAERRREPVETSLRWDEARQPALDALGFLDVRGARLRLALGD